jgi:D-alanine-D-alanine ligase
MKKNVAVIFGGRSCEHDVSIVTAHQVLENADKNKYNLVPVYIDGKGQWYTGEKLMDIAFFRNFDEQQVTQVYLEPNGGSGALYPVQLRTGLLGARRREPLVKIDVAIPAMHGMNGEDGTLQGLLELADIPYTSVGVMGSAVGMDKIAMRLLFKGAGFPVLDCYYAERGQYRADPEAILNAIEKALPEYPLFVKPANLGSSIGISRATDRAGLKNAMEVAYHYDRRVLVERGIDCVEINCSAMGTGDEVAVSLCEQPITSKDMLDFGEKYLHGGKSGSKGMKSLSRIVPAPIDEEMTARIQALTGEIFRVLDCKGVVRIDYMIEKATGELFVNEINTIPGSFAFYLWEPMGVSFTALIDRLIEQAQTAQQEKDANHYAFDSSILQQVSGGAKIKK